MNEFDLNTYLKFWGGKVEKWLEEYVDAWNLNVKGLTDAMRYSLFAGGKRMRPALVYSSYGMFDYDMDKCTPYAAALEMLHTYSLIHDDLPAMDDDDYRRGKLTNHKVYGEATAILAGDALLTKAFEIMLNKNANPDVPENIMVEAAYKLAVAAGDRGMVGGQFADIKAENGNFDDDAVDFIHIHKTSKLISYSCELGAVLGYGSEIDKQNMKDFGMKIGLAFQIADDILDVTATTEQIGKDAGSDVEKGKATYVATYGLDESKKQAQLLVDEAIALVEPYGKSAGPCIKIAKYIVERDK